MLWTDDNFVTLADLLSMDSEISSLVDAEELTLSSLITRGIEAASMAIQANTQWGRISPGDLALRNRVTMPGLSTARTFVHPCQIVVSDDTSWNHVKRYVAFKVLQQIYRAAVNRNADRYENKMQMSVEDGRLAWAQLRHIGIPIVFNPLAAPGATLERQAGTFTASNLSNVAGAGSSTASVEFAVTWVGSATENNQSYRSQRVALQLVNGQVARVSISGLVPPDGTQPAHREASSIYVPGVATHWNVWAGTAGGDMYLQNESPIAISTLTYTLTGNPVSAGTILGFGQHADYLFPLRDELIRG